MGLRQFEARRFEFHFLPNHGSTLNHPMTDPLQFANALQQAATSENQVLSADTETIDVDALWEDFYPRLRAVVAGRVRSMQRCVASESEIALSAFNSFVQGIKEGKFTSMVDRDEMWRLVRTIAIRKANDTRKWLRAQKRGGALAIIGQADFSDAESGPRGIDAATSHTEDPSATVEASDFFNNLLERLPDDRHRDVVLLKLQGASVVTIAECMNTTTRTVQRLLKKVEEAWRSALKDS
jgi:DNA-directed RNA polymerase specialized sigma24 family protein